MSGFEQQSDSPEILAELRRLVGKAGGWECWRGSISGFWYARRHGAEPADLPVREIAVRYHGRNVRVAVASGPGHLRRQ